MRAKPCWRLTNERGELCLEPPLELLVPPCLRSDLGEERQRGLTGHCGQTSLQFRLTEVSRLLVGQTGVVTGQICLVAGVTRHQSVSHCNQSLISHWFLINLCQYYRCNPSSTFESDCPSEPNWECQSWSSEPGWEPGSPGIRLRVSTWEMGANL